MSVKSFEELIAWQRSMNLAEEVYRITSNMPFAKDWGLKDQTRRSGISISSNIAEGFGKYSSREFRKFLAIANGSSYELRSQLILAQRIGYLDENKAKVVIGACIEVSKIIGGLRRTLSS
jgi:four helix bundle protein